MYMYVQNIHTASFGLVSKPPGTNLECEMNYRITGSLVLWTKNRVPTQFSQKTERKSETTIPCLLGYQTLLYNSILK